MIEVETVIVGAGPAGAAAAHRLATAHHQVLLLDKSNFPRDKSCGDGLTAFALRELKAMNFDSASVESWKRIDSATLRTPSGRQIDILLPNESGMFAAIARRRDLDHALVEHAAEGGATTSFGAAVTSVRPCPDRRIELGLADGSKVSARQCIAADGMWSPVRKFLGHNVDGYRGEWHAFRQYYNHVSPAAAGDLHVWFEPDLLPGYAWSFPLGDGSANVGFGILRGGSISTQEMSRLWPDLLTRPHIRDVLGPDARPEAPHRAWPIPAHINRATLAASRTLFVGDAAMACDPLTGEGIGQALLTGKLAADAILAHPDSFSSAAESYESSVRKALVADHRMATALAKLLTRRRVAELALRTVDMTSWTRRSFGRWMFEDYPRALLATPRRWWAGSHH